MNQFDFFHVLLSNAINQSIINTQSRLNRSLPEEQQEAQEKMLKAIHDILSEWKKISPEFRQQVSDTCIAKAASELGWRNGGQYQ